MTTENSQVVEKQKISISTIVITTIICLLPIILGIVFWNSLPSQIPTKYGINDEAKQLAPKWVTVFLLPLLLAFVNCIIDIVVMKQKKNISKNELIFLISIIPVIAVVAGTLMIIKPLGFSVKASQIILPLCGIIFVFSGNYIPKTKQNNAIGLRFPWMLKNEDVWNKTNNIVGKIWVFLGCIILIFSTSKYNFVYFFVSLFLMLASSFIVSLVIAHKEKHSDKKEDIFTDKL